MLHSFAPKQPPVLVSFSSLLSLGPFEPPPPININSQTCLFLRNIGECVYSTQQLVALGSLGKLIPSNVHLFWWAETARHGIIEYETRSDALQSYLRISRLKLAKDHYFTLYIGFPCVFKDLTCYFDGHVDTINENRTVEITGGSGATVNVDATIDFPEAPTSYAGTTTRYIFSSTGRSSPKPTFVPIDGSTTLFLSGIDPNYANVEYLRKQGGFRGANLTTVRICIPRNAGLDTFAFLEFETPLDCRYANHQLTIHAPSGPRGWPFDHKRCIKRFLNVPLAEYIVWKVGRKVDDKDEILKCVDASVSFDISEPLH